MAQEAEHARAEQSDKDVPEQLEQGGKATGEALVKELAKGLTAAGPAGDPEVMVAFALGWQMSELHRPDPSPAADAMPEGDLPGLDRLGGRERTELSLDQIAVGLKNLKAIVDAGLQVPSVEQAKDAIPNGSPGDSFDKAILELHVALLTTLTAAHYKIGKAYELGRTLADTTRVPHDLDTLERKLAASQVTKLTNWLSDLTSLFPPHAGRVVHDSLERWRDWTTPPGPDGVVPSDAISLLRRQGERWRSLLSGEKSATDALHLNDYVKAGDLALSQSRNLALSFLGRFKLAVGAVTLLFVGGLVLIIAEPDTGSVAAGLAGVLASLGLTWKGVGASLGNTAAKMEKPIWEGALDKQITDSILLIPGSEPAERYLPPRPSRREADRGEVIQSRKR